MVGGRELLDVWRGSESVIHRRSKNSATRHTAVSPSIGPIWAQARRISRAPVAPPNIESKREGSPAYFFTNLCTELVLGSAT